MLSVLVGGLSLSGQVADEITGTVHNQSRGLTAAGDEVILLRLDRGMQEERRAKTDSQGAFAIKVQYPDKPYLVRIMHQGVNYDQQATNGQALSIDVYDAVPQAQAISGSLEIIRSGTQGTQLHVSDMMEIKNESSPPVTQAGDRTFDVYLPAKAKLDSVMAAGPGKIGVLITAKPVSGQPGHYTVNFPLRPGSTKFAFNYDIPYDGRAIFRTRLAYPMQQLAVMIPPSMKFSSSSPAFQILNTGSSDFQVEAASQLKAGAGPEFVISGTGAIPALQARSISPPTPKTGAPAAPPGPDTSSSATQAQDARPLQAAPTSSGAAPSQSSGLQWWVLGASVVLVLGTCGFLMWRKQRSSSSSKTVNAAGGKTQPAQTSASLVEALKEELFRLETDRLHGAISGEEYNSAKQALEGTVKRALARSGAKS